MCPVLKALYYFFQSHNNICLEKQSAGIFWHNIFYNKGKSHPPSDICAYTFSAGILKDGCTREICVMQKQIYFCFRKSKEVKAESVSTCILSIFGNGNISH